MDLLRDILDKQVVDRRHVKVGKVDGLVAELRPHAPPRIIAIELGAITLARRLGSRPGRWTAWLAARLAGKRCVVPHQIAWKNVRNIGVDLEVDIDVHQTAIFEWQDWLRDRVIGRIPGA